jgi:hypothetical protein
VKILKSWEKHFFDVTIFQSIGGRGGGADEELMIVSGLLVLWLLSLGSSWRC